MRLGAKLWAIVMAMMLICAAGIPRVWKRFESFPTGPDYRIPYVLSKDYWLYERRLDQACAPGQILILGDSVVWGEYVRPDGTLSHFLNRQGRAQDRFVNAGVNGLFPLALEGLVVNYGHALKNRRVILHCNLLWMSSPRADLSDERPQAFNHSRLVPQFQSRIRSYRADANERISATLENHIGFFAWSNHVEVAYYDQRSVPKWTLEDDGNEPPKYPNAWRNPLEPLRAGIPAEPAIDSQRGPSSRRHRPWNMSDAEPTSFEWVDLHRSLQWQAFQRVVATLRSRGNNVLVILGPFNEHMVAVDQRPTLHAMESEVKAWLQQNGVAMIAPATLPSHLYADASHPLTDGYDLLARRVSEERLFQKWINTGN